MSAQVQRKLTTILAADAEGYSRAMNADEVRALGALHSARGVFSKLIERHHGRIANTAGDGLIAEFTSVVEAVQCAIEVQRELAGSATGDTLRFRIGVHLGDVIVDGDDLLGEGVNLAARLQTMAEPGGVLISEQVYDQVYKKLSVGFEYLGEKRPKNYAEDVAVYRVAPTGRKARAAADAPRARRARRPEPPPDAKLRERVTRHAILLGAIWLVLVAINVVTGDTLWAHWLGLAMATFVALEACPLVVRGWLKLQYARIVVIVTVLALVNLLTWSGYPWFLWPAGALLIIELARHLWRRPH